MRPNGEITNSRTERFFVEALQPDPYGFRLVLQCLVFTLVCSFVPALYAQDPEADIGSPPEKASETKAEESKAGDSKTQPSEADAASRDSLLVGFIESPSSFAGIDRRRGVP